MESVRKLAICALALSLAVERAHAQGDNANERLVFDGWLDGMMSERIAPADRLRGLQVWQQRQDGLENYSRTSNPKTGVLKSFLDSSLRAKRLDEGISILYWRARELMNSDPVLAVRLFAVLSPYIYEVRRDHKQISGLIRPVISNFDAHTIEAWGRFDGFNSFVRDRDPSLLCLLYGLLLSDNLMEARGFLSVQSKRGPLRAQICIYYGFSLLQARGPTNLGHPAVPRKTSDAILAFRTAQSLDPFLPLAWYGEAIALDMRTDGERIRKVLDKYFELSDFSRKRLSEAHKRYSQIGKAH